MAFSLKPFILLALFFVVSNVQAYSPKYDIHNVHSILKRLVDPNDPSVDLLSFSYHDGDKIIMLLTTLHIYIAPVSDLVYNHRTHRFTMELNPSMLRTDLRDNSEFMADVCPESPYCYNTIKDIIVFQKNALYIGVFGYLNGKLCMNLYSLGSNSDDSFGDSSGCQPFHEKLLTPVSLRSESFPVIDHRSYNTTFVRTFQTGNGIEKYLQLQQRSNSSLAPQRVYKGEPGNRTYLGEKAGDPEFGFALPVGESRKEIAFYNRADKTFSLYRIAQFEEYPERFQVNDTLMNISLPFISMADGTGSSEHYAFLKDTGIELRIDEVFRVKVDVEDWAPKKVGKMESNVGVQILVILAIILAIVAVLSITVCVLVCSFKVVRGILRR